MGRIPIQQIWNNIWMLCNQVHVCPGSLFYHGLCQLLSSWKEQMQKTVVLWFKNTSWNKKNTKSFVLCFAINKSSPENTKAHYFEKIKKPFINGLSAYAFQLTVLIRSYKSKQKFTDIKACVSCQAIWGNHTFMCVITVAFSPNIWNIIKVIINFRRGTASID